MSDTGPRTPYLGRYLAVLVAVTLGLSVLRVVVARVWGFELPTGAMTIIPPMIAALHVGQRWGKDRGEIPANAVAWRWALVAGLVYLAINLLLVPLGLMGQAITPTLLTIITAMLAFSTLAAVVLNRFMLTTGAKGTVAAPKGR